MRRPSLSCQVEGCTADLGTLRPYFQRQHICEDHARADEIPDGRGGLVRFCQQCTKLEPISAFDGKKRSCQASLVKRHHRRSGGTKRNYAGHARSATTGRGSASRGGPADTAARSLAVLADAALPDDDEEEQGQQGMLPMLPPMVPLPIAFDLPSISYDARGSGILGKPQPVRPLPLGSNAPAPFGQPALPPGSATSGWSSLPQAPAPPLFPNFGGPAPANGSSPPALGLGPTAGVGSTPDVASLLALLAARQAEGAAGGPADQAGTAAAAAAAATAAAAPKEEPVERPADLQQLLTALQLLQQLQQSITNVVVAQLQQHLARQEASSLLEQRLLPLLGSIRAQLGPKGDSSSLAQLEQLVASLNQLSGMLQPPPAAQDQQALGLLQWLQSAGAMGLPGGPAASAPSPAPSPVVRAEPAAAPAGGDPDQVQAMLQRVAGLLKLQKELGTA
ncbi:hypothetical protein COHA_005811 [Chlorella ohadii]|uniref:SBP-type domain-containing protein n=1 Tax=Chlorella ohadii TaxID=2649997 RepID=A0AAD5DM42_9CHLO|nr:hypothetical protein COHA_005811 [Chlorella ohadii]